MTGDSAQSPTPTRIEVEFEIESLSRSLKEISDALGCVPDPNGSFSRDDIEPAMRRTHGRTAWRLVAHASHTATALSENCAALAAKVLKLRARIDHLVKAGDSARFRVAAYFETACVTLTLSPSALEALSECGFDIEITCYPVED